MSSRLAFNASIAITVAVSAATPVLAQSAPLSALIAIGPSLAFFAARRHLDTTCQGSSCVTIQEGYEPGLVLAATGSMALGLQVSAAFRLFSEARVHVPSRIGRSGYAKDSVCCSCGARLRRVAPTLSSAG